MINYYDFPAREWRRGSARMGAVGIYANDICAFYQQRGNYSPRHIEARLEQRVNGYYDDFGRKHDLKPMNKYELFQLDWEFILNAIADGESVLMWTNTREDPEWVETVENCPHARELCTVPSKMDKYDVTMWLLQWKEKDAVHSEAV